jgi:hypothetical protein
MKKLTHYILATAAALALVIPVAAQQQTDHQGTTPPLVQLLQSKGILTAAEAAQISKASSADEANARLAQLLVAKGLISQKDAEQTVSASAMQTSSSSSSAHMVNAVIHVPSKDSPNYPDATANAGGGSPDDTGPDSIHYKGITLIPGGFFAGTGTWRQRATVSDASTPFNAIPFSTQNIGNISESNYTARQSLISLLAVGKLDNTTVRGYVEGDFQGAGTTSNNSSTNSYLFRIRQAWAQAALNNGWTFTFGQMWSLATANKKGVDPRTEVIPLTIDSAYTVGFNYARQSGMRVGKKFGDVLSVAFAAESAELNSAAGTACPAGSCLIVAQGNTTGLFNSVGAGGAAQNYSFNATPDFIFKAAADTHFGHYELFGILNTFRARVFPCYNSSVAVPCFANGAVTPTSAGAGNQTNVGGGIGVNAYWSNLLSNHLDANFTFVAGNGIGRYGGTDGYSDVVFNSNLVPVALRNYRGYAGLTAHVSSKLDVYGYFGGDYLQRDHAYGNVAAYNAQCVTEPLPASDVSPGEACNGQTRDIIEGTVGTWYRWYQGPKGTLQSGMQYSYVTRISWADSTGLAPHAIDNMFFSSFRYYLP